MRIDMLPETPELYRWVERAFRSQRTQAFEAKRNERGALVKGIAIGILSAFGIVLLISVLPLS